MTKEGRNYLLDAGIKGASQITAWYIAPFKNNYTPTDDDVAATISALAGESTAYTSATRVAVTFGAVADSSVDNSAAVATLTANAAETWYGSMLFSVATKGATSGKLVAIERFSAARVMTAGTNIDIAVDLSLIAPT